MRQDKIIFDVETTGLLKPEASSVTEQPFITEFYAARLDKNNKVIGEVDSLISVPVEIEPFITRLTGIDNTMLIGQPEFIEIYKPLTELFIGTRTIVAHNLPFDSGMLWAELFRLGLEFKFPWPPEWYCTIEHSMYIEGKRLKLSKLHKYATGEEFKEGAHRAKQDTMALLRCYKWLVKEESK